MSSPADKTFTCPLCCRSYGDPHYHGPPGHAPQCLCLDCWGDEWAAIQARMLNGGDWTALDSALWLICAGFTRQQAAGIIGVARRTLYRWIRVLKMTPHKTPQWLRPGDSPIPNDRQRGTNR